MLHSLKVSGLDLMKRVNIKAKSLKVEMLQDVLLQTSRNDD